MNNFFIINELDIKLSVITHKLDNPDAILIHLHGLHGHFQYIYNCIDDFNERIEYFKKANILSYALEFRGHGKSSGKKGVINNIDNFISDVKRLLEYIECLNPNKPIYLLAESMGAAVAVKTSMSLDKIKGIILLAPMFNISKKSKPNDFTINFLLFLSKYLPELKLISKNKRNVYQFDEYNLKYLLSDFTIKDSINLVTFKECYKICKWIIDNRKDFNKELLIIHSKTDGVTCIDESINFFNECSSTDKDIMILDEGHHSVLVPLSKDDIIPDSLVCKITNWINHRI